MKDMVFFVNEVIQNELVQCSQYSDLVYRLDDRNCVSIPSRDRRFFSSPECLKLAFGPTKLTVQWVLEPHSFGCRTSGT